MTKRLAPWRSFGGRLYSVFAMLLVLVAGLGAAGYIQLTHAENISDAVVDTAAVHSIAQTLAVELAELDSHLDDFIVVGDGPSRRNVEGHLVEIGLSLTDLTDRITAGTTLATDIQGTVDETSVLVAHIDEFIMSESMSSGERNRMIASIFAHLDEVRGLFNDFNAESLARVDGELVVQTEILSGLTLQLLLLSILILLILIATSLFVRSTVRSIGKVTDTAVAIAAGDLDREVPVHRRDEIGVLAGAFNSMTKQIRELIGSLELRVAERTAELSDANEALTGEITERQHAEAELRRSKDFAEAVINSMSESIAIVDASDFTIVGANKVFLDSADAGSAADLVGLTCYAVTHGREEPCVPPDDECPLVELLAGKPMAAVEHMHRGSGGEVRYAEVSVSPIPTESGEITRVVHVSRDITERKRAEEVLRDYAARLEGALQELGNAQSQLLQAQKMEAIGGLAAGIAHEINTPIQYVADNTRFLQDAFTDLLSLQAQVGEMVSQCAGPAGDVIRTEYRAAVEDTDVEYLADEIPAAISQAIDGVNKVAEIVRALKDFSHPGGDSKAPLDLNQLVTNTIMVCKNEWKYVAELRTEFDSQLPLVPALSGPLGQALLILIVNAAQAMQEHQDSDDGLGSIVVTTAADSSAATIEVADSGPGIPDEIQGKVFDHFFTTKEVGKGSGQGLAIARSIVVEQHGGELDLTSTVGVGTTFCIRIPLEMGEAEAA